ncbi:deoxyribodipyrimidine photolyase [Deinococcus detaillensis]|uniref:Deoxyribodipyrimidine photolyase n=1 Tax=Deinococcus detaillensis TaxID=2592048 RepID=A0A553UHC4_9DEIO|nr:FAD-binding domain-containing protein [Deinococcus detaillensis]TSA79411.1 deoxyribodipyrimidine photolyase [Deinococcus detaillensis]
MPKPPAPLPASLRDTPPAELFPDIFAQDLPHRGFARGGRAAALGALAAIDPVSYGRDRSYLDGHVTRLSPYLRHGVLTLAEVRDAALTHAPDTAPSQVWKYVNELSWRDYSVRVYAEVGDLIWQDFEPYKTGLPASTYSREFPADIKDGATGAACIDAWSRELRQTGYLHNHVRMWLASYVVHHRRVWWQGGAAWFLTHLLDGDPSSNNLGWQWVASTWRAYPYLWNRGALVKYAGDRYCASCPLADAGCPFDATYTALSERLFEDKEAAPGESSHLEPTRLEAVLWEPPLTPEVIPGAVVWVHGDRLSPTNEALTAYPKGPAMFVWDDALLKEWEISAKRQTFIHECVQELPVHVLRGDVAAEVIRFARAHGASTVATTPSPSPRFRAIVTALEGAGLTVQHWPEPVFGESLTPLDLRIHGEYWRQISASAFGKDPAPPKPKRPRAKKGKSNRAKE